VLRVSTVGQEASEVEVEHRMAAEPSGRGFWLRRRRRLLLSMGLVAGVFGATAVVGWNWGLPNYRPTLRPGETYGVDVSNHQGPIDWAKVARDDVSFAYIKATEGRDFVDRSFEANWAGAAAAGIPRGAYHFFTLCAPGAAQAANFLRVVPTAPDALPPAVDLEYAGCERRPSAEEFSRELRTFISTVEQRTGRRVLIYSIEVFEKRYPLDEWSDRRQWERRLFRRPETDDWTVWQVSHLADIDGVSGGVDLDVGRLAELQRP
jgi:lysozyme